MSDKKDVDEIELNEIKDGAIEEIKKAKNSFKEIKGLFDDGFQFSDLEEIHNIVKKNVGKLCWVAQNLKRFSEKGNGRNKRKWVIKFIDKAIKLPFPLEMIDGFVIGFIVDSAANAAKKAGWDLKFFS